MTEDGKLIIDDPEDSTPHRTGPNPDGGMEIDTELTPMEAMRKRKKRVRVEEEEEEENESSTTPTNAPAKPTSANKRQKNSEDKYSSKHTKGDVKKKGNRLEPYSYIPLNPKFLNKRRRATAYKQFAGTVGATNKTKQKQPKRN